MLRLKAQLPAAPTTSMGMEEEVSLTPVPGKGGGQLSMPCAGTSWVKGLWFGRVNILLPLPGTNATHFLCRSEDLRRPRNAVRGPDAAHRCAHTPAAASSHKHLPVFSPPVLINVGCASNPTNGERISACILFLRGEQFSLYPKGQSNQTS